MDKYFSNKNSKSSLTDSEMFQGKIREEDLAKQEELDEIIREADEFAKLKEKIEEQVYKEAYDELSQLLSDIKLYTDSSEFEMNEGLLQAISNWLENILDAVNLLNKKKDNKGWLFSLLKRLFSRELSWEERLNQEIEELKEKLENDELSEEERLEILERLQLLQSIKLSGIVVIGTIFGIIASFIRFDLGVAKSKEFVRETREKISRIRESEHKFSEKAEQETKQEIKDEKFIVEDKEIFKTLSNKRTPDPSILLNVSDIFIAIDDFVRNLPEIKRFTELQLKSRDHPAAIAAPEPKPPVKESELQNRQELEGKKRDTGSTEEENKEKQEEKQYSVHDAKERLLRAKRGLSGSEEKTQKPNSHVEGIQIERNNTRSR